MYNFGQMIIELFNEEPKHFGTFCYLVEHVLPSSLNALEPDGTVPGISTYEAKLLVCGLSRAFFGRSNSVAVTVDGHLRSSNDLTSGVKDSHARTSSKPAMLGSDE